MGGYTNGAWPESMFIVYDEGVDGDGPWKHLVTAGTQHKINRLKELAYKRTKRRLEISPGWSCYRPIGPQRTYRARYGTGASVVGKSSHGINWWDGDRGWRIVLAVDFHNWGWVYGWDRDAWYEDVRAAGLEPGLIHPSRGNGYPDEPWHVIDLNPFAAPPEPHKPNPDIEDEDEMKLIRWNQHHVFAIGREAIYHVPNPTEHGTAEALYGATRDVDNAGLTTVLLTNGIQWEAVDAVLRGAGYGSNGRYWSRLMGEGIAIRGNQAAASKTLADVLATAKKIEATS